MKIFNRILRLVILTSVVFKHACEGQDSTGPTPATQAILNGTTHRLTCSRSSGTANMISWYKSPNIQLFLSTTKVVFDKEFNNFEVDQVNTDQLDLVMTDMTTEDEGGYYCQLAGTNIASGVVTRTVEVELASLKMMKDGSEVSQPIDVIEDIASEVICEAKGARPAVDIEWFEIKDNIQAPITSGIFQTNVSTDGGDTFDTTSTLSYVTDKDYNRGILKCVTTGQEVASPKMAIASLVVQYAPDVNVQYGDDMVRCSSDANPEVAYYDYLIIVNNTMQFIPTCANGMCILPLEVITDTHVRCNATNAIGTGTSFVTAVPGAVITTTSTSTQTKTSLPDSEVPITAVAVPLALIAAACIAFAIAVMWVKRHTRQADKDQIDSKRQNPTQPGTATGPNTPQTYMELNAQTREKEQTYEEPRRQSSGSQSPTYEDIADAASSKDQVYHEIGDNSKKDDQLADYVNVKPTTKAGQARRE